MRKLFSRRQFIKASAVGIAAASAAVAAAKISSEAKVPALPNPYPVLPDKKPEIALPSSPPLFLNDHQYLLVAAIAALIIPTDEDPGANEAGVADYIDRLVAESEKDQKRYIKGLKWIDNVSRDWHNKDFVALTVKEQVALLIAIDESESKIYRPVSGLLERINCTINASLSKLFGVGLSEKFFDKIRTDVFYGYYSSPISWKSVGYYGPPQPVGYLDHATAPSPEYYIDIVRPVDNDTCQHCHFDVMEKHENKEQDECMECHEPHSPIKEYIKNG